MVDGFLAITVASRYSDLDVVIPFWLFIFWGGVLNGRDSGRPSGRGGGLVPVLASYSCDSSAFSLLTKLIGSSNCSPSASTD